MLHKKHPQHIIDYGFTKIFQSKFQNEYINNEKLLLKQAPLFTTAAAYQVLHIIMESLVVMISHIATGTSHSTCDIKLLYAHIRHNLFNITVKYWIEKLRRTIYCCH